MWRFTGFYRHPNTNKRHDAWNLLRHLKNMESGPWMCACDFNKILELSEKVGGMGRTQDCV